MIGQRSTPPEPSPARLDPGRIHALGTHLDGEIHFYTAVKDIAQLELNDFLVGPGVVVDLSDAVGD